MDKKLYKKIVKIMFNNEEMLQRGMKMDKMAMEDLITILDFMKKKNLIKKNIKINQAAFSIYFIFFGQTMSYLFDFENMTKNQFKKGVKEMICMFFNGIKSK